MSRALALPVALALLALGCNDKAQPAYDACIAAEKNNDYPLAVQNCEAAIAADPTSTAGKAAAEKATEIHRKVDDTIPPTVTPDFCARLRRRLEPRLQAEIEAKTENTDRDFVRKTVHETVNAYVTKLERECNQAAGRSATGYWTCAWNESFNNPKQCDALRAAEREAAGGGTPSPGRATQPDATQTAADTIRAHPDLISIVPDEWQTRISATITGDAAGSCPALKFVAWKDEFEKKERQESAVASCSADNQKALAFAKTCPLVATLNVKLTDYDFDAKRYRVQALSHGSADTVLVTSRGRVYLPDGSWLLTWAGPHIRSRGEGLPSGGCIGALNDAIPQLAGFTLDLPMPESDARAFHTQMPSSRAAGRGGRGGSDLVAAGRTCRQRRRPRRRTCRFCLLERSNCLAERLFGDVPGPDTLAVQRCPRSRPAKASGKLARSASIRSSTRPAGACAARMPAARRSTRPRTVRPTTRSGSVIT